MNRRGFLGSILALGAAPAIVRADSLMRVVPISTTILSASDFTWYTAYEGLRVVERPELGEIITKTLRERSARFAENVQRSNEALREMRLHGWVDYK